MNSRARKERIAQGGAVLLAAVTLAACGSPSHWGREEALERDPNARALLDRANARVTLPTSEYQASDELTRKMSQAAELMIRPCLRSAGYDVPVPDSGVSEDRIWGLWDVERARRNGFRLEGDLSRPSEPQTEEYAEARKLCWDSAQPEREALQGNAPEELLSVAQEIEMRASIAARESEEFAQLHELYSDCLQEHGYRTEPGFFGVASGTVETANWGPPAVDEIRAAVAEAQCNVDLDVTQTMGDLEASYSAPMIRERQAELNEEKEAFQAMERRVDEYLRNHQ